MFIRFATALGADEPESWNLIERFFVDLRSRFDRRRSICRRLNLSPNDTAINTRMAICYFAAGMKNLAEFIWSKFLPQILDV